MSIFKKSLTGVLGVGISKVLKFVSTFILAYFLGSSDYGILVICIGILTISRIVSSIGLSGGLLRYISTFQAKGQTEKIKGIIYSSAILVTVLSSLVSLSLLFFKDAIVKQFEVDPQVLNLFIFLVPIASLNTLILNFLRARKDILKQQILANLEIGILITLILLLSLTSLNVVNAAFAFILSQVITLIIGFFFIQNIVIRSVKHMWFSEGFWMVIKYSTPFLLTSIFNLSLTNFDRLLVGYFLKPEAVGVYGITSQISMQLNIVLIGISTAIVPFLSQLHINKDYEQVEKIYKAFSYYAVILSFPIFLILFTAPELILSLFGEDFTEGKITLQILAVAQLFNCMTGPIGAFYEMVNKAYVSLRSVIIIGILNISLNAVLIPIYGIIGAAISTGISISLVYFFLYAMSKRITGLKLFDSRILISFLIILGFVVFTMLLSMFINSEIFNLITSLIAFFITTYFFLLTKKDKTNIKSLILKNKLEYDI